MKSFESDDAMLSILAKERQKSYNVLSEAVKEDDIVYWAEVVAAFDKLRNLIKMRTTS